MGSYKNCCKNKDFDPSIKIITIPFFQKLRTLLFFTKCRLYLRLIQDLFLPSKFHTHEWQSLFKINQFENCNKVWTVQKLQERLIVLVYADARTPISRKLHSLVLPSRSQSGILKFQVEKWLKKKLI